MSELEKATRKLSIRHQKILEVLLVGGTDAQAAEASGMHRNGVYNLRHNNEAFKAALEGARKDLLKRTGARLHASTTIAVKALEEVAKDVRNPSARVAASKAIIEFSQKAVEMEEMEVRLTALEERLAEQKAHKR